jgi:hypothetical protein
VTPGQRPRRAQRIALKVLHAEFAVQPEIINRFFNEAEAVNDIQHPNIVDIIDFGTLPPVSPSDPPRTAHHRTGRADVVGGVPGGLASGCVGRCRPGRDDRARVVWRRARIVERAAEPVAWEVGSGAPVTFTGRFTGRRIEVRSGVTASLE